MSGPIVRKYGFPNFEKIFGERPLEHGVDDPGQSEPPQKPQPDSGSSSTQDSSDPSQKVDPKQRD